jgi:hypothetical protein
MTGKKEPVERRQRKWFRVRDGAFVIFRPGDTGMVRLIDISMGGLQFDCDSWHASPMEAAELDICLPGSAFILYDVPCRSIGVLSIYGKSDTPYRKRYEVHFGKLSQAQISQLEYFIQNHTERKGCRQTTYAH